MTIDCACVKDSSPFVYPLFTLFITMSFVSFHNKSVKFYTKSVTPQWTVKLLGWQHFPTFHFSKQSFTTFRFYVRYAWNMQLSKIFIDICFVNRLTVQVLVKSMNFFKNLYIINNPFSLFLYEMYLFLVPSLLLKLNEIFCTFSPFSIIFFSI